MYGEYLFERREFSQAALGRGLGMSDSPGIHSIPLVFIQADKPAKALIAYEKALDWRELFDLAVGENTPQDELIEIGLRVAGEAIFLSQPSALTGSPQTI